MDILKFQESEITEYEIYSFMASKQKGKNAEVLKKIANMEKSHYDFWRSITKKDLKPNKLKLFYLKILYYIFGLVFLAKYMEKGENKAYDRYSKMINHYKGIEKLIADEKEHEKLLIRLLKEERSSRLDSIVLGINDALVEITGAIVGFTFTFASTQAVAIASLITGFAASLSMAASEYLSKKMEKDNKPFKASLFTGQAYIFTVIILVLPYFFINNRFFALFFTILFAFFVIALFNFYSSIINEKKFLPSFLEMSVISSFVALLSFLFAYLLKILFGV